MVISVIAVLVGLLIPAFRLVGIQAHRVVCQKHLEQLTLAWLVYTDDYANLYVIGSANFVTAGAANPTLTIIALTLRAADFLLQETGF